MPSMHSQSSVVKEDPHLSSSDLLVSIAVDEAKEPLVLLVTVTNLHPSTSITLLAWDSPLDNAMLKLGIAHIRDTTTGQEVPLPEIKFKRKLPPSDDAFYEIARRAAVTRTYEMTIPGVEFTKGNKYTISLRGKWRAVWHASVADIGEMRLQQLGGGTGILQGPFESNEVSFVAP